MEQYHNELKQRLLQDLERLDGEKWDLLDRLSLNELARSAILEVIRHPDRPADAA